MSHRMHSLFLGFFLCLISLSSFSHEELYAFSTPVEKARFETLTSELRCLVCQNETLAESGATLAADLRQQIHEKMQAGQSDQQILAYLVSRYGDFILYRPPLRKATLLLWFGPLLFLIVGAFVLHRVIRPQKESRQ